MGEAKCFGSLSRARGSIVAMFSIVVEGAVGFSPFIGVD